MRKIFTKVTSVMLSTAIVLSTGFFNIGLNGIAIKAHASIAYDIETEEEKQEKDEKKQTEKNVKEEEQNNYIVTLKDEKSYEKLEISAKENDLLPDTETPVKKELEENQMMVLNLSQDEAKQIEELNGVDSLEEDFSITANEVVEPDEELLEEVIEEKKTVQFHQWNLDAIRLPAYRIATKAGITNSTKASIAVSGSAVKAESKKQKKEKYYTGKGVKIAILDSGISYGENIFPKERVNLIEGTKEGSPLFDDSTGHGISLMGIIAAQREKGCLQGIAPNAKVYSVKVLDRENTAPVSRIISGIYWCIENNIDVLNMSFGMSEYSAALEEAVQDAKEAGIIMVAAVGNHGDSTSTIDYPAAFPEVIAVGATNGENQITEFTSKGEGIDILAPGEKIWTSGFFGGITTVDGTSIATAHVTGAVAQLLEKIPKADSTFIRQLLKASSAKVEETEGLGLLDVKAALEMGEDFTPVEEENIQPQERELTEYDTQGIVTGCWNTALHRNMITGTEENYDPNMPNTTVEIANVLSDSEIDLVAGAAGRVDAQLPTSKYDPTNPYERVTRYGLLHGQHNYVVMLKFLYKAAKKANSSGKKLSDRTQAMEYLNTIDITHTEDVSYGNQDLVDMREMVADIFSNTFGVTMSSELGADTKAKKAWILIGVAAHQLSDTYAHRTLLPKSALKDMNKNHFTDWSTFQKKVNYGVIEFRDIKFYQNSLNTSLYEDNADFCFNRYYASCVAVKNLILAYEKKKNFSVKEIMTEGTEGYMTGQGLKLNNFDNYAWSSGSQDDVMEVSTTAYHANSVNGSVKLNELDYVDYNYFIC